jgi:hypothetical protein
MNGLDDSNRFVHRYFKDQRSIKGTYDQQKGGLR